MTNHGSRLTLGRLMGVIALFALIFAVSPPLVGIYLSVDLSGVVGLIILVARFGGVPKVRAALWVLIGYSWLSLALLYLTWLVAWSTLGHPPRSSIDDPQMISVPVSTLRYLTFVLILGVWPTLFVCPLLIFGEAMLAVERGGPSRSNEVARLLLIPLLLWLGAFLILGLDPGRVLD